MSDPVKNKPCKTKSNTKDSQSFERQQTLKQSSTSTVTSYFLQFSSYVRRLMSDKQVSSDELKELIRKTEEKIKEIYGNIIKELKAFHETELRSCKNYSKAELAKAEIKFKEYSSKLIKILTELMKRLQILRNEFQIQIMTTEDGRNLIKYFDEKIEQTKRLTQDMTKNIQETISDPELKRKLETIVETNYKKVRGSMNSLLTGIKKATAVGVDQRVGKSLKSTTTAYISQIIFHIRDLVSGKSNRIAAPVPQNVKDLLTQAEIKVKELYDEILKKVEDLHANKLHSYKKYSKEELIKVKSSLQQYSVKLQKLSENMIQRLRIVKNELHTRMITQTEFQSFVFYFESKIVETKKLTKNVIINIQSTINDPMFVKKLQTLVDINSQKIKVAMDDLYTAVKKNVTKVGQLKSLPDVKRLFPTAMFGKVKTSVDCSSASTLPSINNDTSATDCKENSVVRLNKAKSQFCNLSKHFNSRTIYGRANVAKATYAGILIYYIYTKVKNTTT